MDLHAHCALRKFYYIEKEGVFYTTYAIFYTTITYWGMHYYILRNINNDAFTNTSLLTFICKILLARLNETVTCNS